MGQSLYEAFYHEKSAKRAKQNTRSSCKANRQKHSKNDPDASFMIAACQYLLHHFDAAQTSLEKAIYRGDRGKSVDHLQRLIDQGYKEYGHGSDTQPSTQPSENNTHGY